MEKKTLSELIEESAAIESMLIDAGGEITEDIEAHLKEWENDFETKVDAYGVIMERFDLAKEYWAQKAAVMTKMEKQMANLKDRLKQRLKWGMHALNKDSVSGDEYAFKLVNMSPKVVIDDEEILPREVFEKTETWKPSKQKIKDMLFSGGFVPGARLEENQALRQSLVKKEQ